MSGGSYSYIYSRLLSECEGNMYDAEMDDMIRTYRKQLRRGMRFNQEVGE